jgi:hypothetical protein
MEWLLVGPVPMGKAQAFISYVIFYSLHCVKDDPRQRASDSVWTGLKNGYAQVRAFTGTTPYDC